MTALTFEPCHVCGPPQAGSHFTVQRPKIQTGVVLAPLSVLFAGQTVMGGKEGGQPVLEIVWRSDNLLIVLNS